MARALWCAERRRKETIQNLMNNFIAFQKIDNAVFHMEHGPSEDNNFNCAANTENKQWYSGRLIPYGKLYNSHGEVVDCIYETFDNVFTINASVSH